MRAAGNSEAIAALEGDHLRAAALHAEVEEIFSQLSAEKIARLREALAELTGIYTGHIQVEDNFVFPLAGRTLDRETQLAIGREMATRRGVHIR